MNIIAHDNIGLRVTDRTRSLAFYQALGFRLDQDHSTDRALEIVNAAGVRLNLILNDASTAETGNTAAPDRPRKWPGHAAFVVANLSQLIDWATKADVPIAEGPVNWGLRMTCLLRDPDSNMLEFNELKSNGKAERCALLLDAEVRASRAVRASLPLNMPDVACEDGAAPLFQRGRGRNWRHIAETWASRIRDAGWHADPTLSLAALARRLGTNPTYLSRAFNDGLGVHFSSFVNRLRCEDVAKVLRRGDRRELLGLAFEAGFSSKASFNRAFRANFGMAARDFRRLHGAKMKVVDRGIA